MKKKIKYLLFMILCNIFVVNVYAASASIKATASSSKVQIGDTVTVKVTVSSGSTLGSWNFSVGYNSNVFTYVSSTMENGLTSLGVVSNANTYNKEYTLKFKAKAAGSGTFTVNNSTVYGLDESMLSTSNGSATVTVVAPSTTTTNTSTNTSNDSKKSANNYLSSLSVDNYSISPKFNKSTTKYDLSVPNDVRKIKINAKAEDKNASVSGTGEKELKEGKNKLEIVVKAENGNKKTYVLNVTVQDREPVVVKIGDNEYTVLQTSEGLTIPNSYSQVTETINDNEVTAYKSGLTGYTLVGLTDKDGKTNLYIYSDNNFTLYNEYKFAGISLYIKEPSVMLEGVTESSITLNEETIKAYTLKGLSYPLVYGMNVETGEENWYTYDESEKTVQKLVVENKDGNKGVAVAQNIASSDKFKALALLMSGVSGLLLVFLIVSAVKISKQNKPEI